MKDNTFPWLVKIPLIIISVLVWWLLPFIKGPSGKVIGPFPPDSVAFWGIFFFILFFWGVIDAVSTFFKKAGEATFPVLWRDENDWVPDAIENIRETYPPIYWRGCRFDPQVLLQVPIGIIWVVKDEIHRHDLAFFDIRYGKKMFRLTPLKNEEWHMDKMNALDLEAVGRKILNISQESAVFSSYSRRVPVSSLNE